MQLCEVFVVYVQGDPGTGDAEYPVPLHVGAGVCRLPGPVWDAESPGDHGHLPQLHSAAEACGGLPHPAPPRHAASHLPPLSVQVRNCFIITLIIIFILALTDLISGATEAAATVFR